MPGSRRAGKGLYENPCAFIPFPFFSKFHKKEGAFHKKEIPEKKQTKPEERGERFV